MSFSRKIFHERIEFPLFVIRLWFSRLRATNVLIIGIKGVTAEIVKNIVLAGAGNVTIVDETKVTAADLGANFFLTKDDIDKPVRAF